MTINNPISAILPINVEGLEEYLDQWMSDNFIYTGTEPPTNPIPGMIWREMNITQLVDMWVFSDEEWVSLDEKRIDFWSQSGNFSANVSFRLPAEISKRIIITSCDYHVLFSSGVVDATNYWRIMWSLQPSAVNMADVYIQSNPGVASQSNQINQIFDIPSTEFILLMINKYGTAPSARIGTTLKYRTVRTEN